MQARRSVYRWNDAQKTLRRAERRWQSTSSGAAFAPVREQYQQTISHFDVKEGAPVLAIGTGKASSFHHGVGQKYGTNIVAAVSPGRGGDFLGKPVYSSLSEAVRSEKPYCASVFVPLSGAADAVIDCIEAEIPLIVAVAEGIPTQDQLRVQAALRSQKRSRVVGANCPGMILPHIKFKIGIQPLAVHQPGIVGLAARSGTISYELASRTSELGFGQSVVFGLGGDPFPSTRTWEALSWMLDDPKTKVICLVGEIGGQMEEEAACVLQEYRKNLPAGIRPKPVVGFVAGQQTLQSRMYGHSGAIWHQEHEKTLSKMKIWEDAGISVAKHLGEVGKLLSEAVDSLHRP